MTRYLGLGGELARHASHGDVPRTKGFPQNNGALLVSKVSVTHPDSA
jgi:hypothetical protein